MLDPLKLIGSTVSGKYRVRRLVAMGRSSLVYEAVDDNRCTVALKALHVLADTPAKERADVMGDLVEQATILAPLSHFSTLSVVRDVIAMHKDGAWIPITVSDWLDGTTLESRLAGRGASGIEALFSLGDAVRLLGPLVDALTSAHQRGIHHGEIVPGCLLVLNAVPAGSKEVALLNLGTAPVLRKHLARRRGVEIDERSSLWTPEQFAFLQRPLGPSADVAGIAHVLTEMIAPCGASRPPVDPRTASPPTPRAIGATVNDRVEAIFAMALSGGVVGAWPTLDAFWRELQQAVPRIPSGRPTLMGLSPRETMEADRVTPEATVGHGTVTRRVLELSSDDDDDLPAPARRPTAQRRWSLAPPTPPRGPVRTTAPSMLQAAPREVLDSVPPTSRSDLEIHDPEHDARPPSRALAWVLAVLGAIVAAVLGIGATGYMKRGAPVTAEPAVFVATKVAAGAEAPSPCPRGMVRVPGGGFFMGSDDEVATERPAHRVTLAPYCIDTLEVTTAKYKACSDAGDCKRAAMHNAWPGITAREVEVLDPICNVREPVARAEHPINCVDWEMASVYCAAAGARLPTEAEWEFAARGPDGRRYPWGDDPPAAFHLNACGGECSAWSKRRGIGQAAMYVAEDGWPTTAPVGSFPKGASRYGLEDVVGNVGEWVSDWYAPYDAKTEANPRGPTTGEARVVRGGGWNGGQPALARATLRQRNVPQARSHGIGFRCARSAQEQ